MGVAIDVQDLCRDTIVAEELVNVTGVVNCSAETSSLTEMYACKMHPFLGSLCFVCGQHFTVEPYSLSNSKRTSSQ